MSTMETKTWLRVLAWLVVACAALAVWYQSRENGEGISRAVQAAVQYEQLAQDWRQEARAQKQERRQIETTNRELRAEVQRLGTVVNGLSARWTDAEADAEQDLIHYADLTTLPTCATALSSCTEARRAAADLIQGQRQREQALQKELAGRDAVEAALRAETVAYDSAATSAERQASELQRALDLARRSPIALPSSSGPTLPSLTAARGPVLAGDVGVLHVPTLGPIGGIRVVASVGVGWRGWSVSAGTIVDPVEGTAVPTVGVRRTVFRFGGR